MGERDCRKSSHEKTKNTKDRLVENFMCLDEVGDKSDLPLHFPFLQSAVSSPPSLLVHIVSLSRRAVAEVRCLQCRPGDKQRQVCAKPPNIS